jgi:hypothetical protein
LTGFDSSNAALLVEPDRAQFRGEIEPGIYLSRVAGIRIEDLVVVTTDAARC